MRSTKTIFCLLRNAYKILVGKTEGKSPVGNLGIDGTIMLRWILTKCGVRMWTGFTWLGIGTSKGMVFVNTSNELQSRDSSVGIALGCWLDDRGSRVRVPAGAGNFSLHHRVQNGSGTHPASYLMGTRGSFLGGKAAGA
jgi:hypothetical protein